MTAHFGPTGKTEVDMIIRAMRSPGEIMRDAKGKPIIGHKSVGYDAWRRTVDLTLLIEDCRGNSSLRGIELPWITYSALHQLVQGG